MTMWAEDHPIPFVAMTNDNLTVSNHVQTLKAALFALIDDATDAEVQIEASRILNLVAALGPQPEGWALTLIEAGIRALKAKNRNVNIAKFIRNRLEIESRNQKRGLVPWISRKLSDSPVYAMLVGVLSSGVVWLLVFIAVLAVGSELNKLAGTDFYMSPVETKPLVFAAFVGSLVSLLSRINEFANLYIFDPFLVFLNSLLKPLIGTVFALTIYAIMKSHIVQLSGITLEVGPDNYRYVFWAFGFVAGFSERLAGDFIARAETVVGRPGENKEQVR